MTKSNSDFMYPDPLNRLHHKIQRCQLCRLSETRTHPVPGHGDISHRLMMIGEAPGRKEDESGLPFQGRSGETLDHALEQIGMHRDQFYITSSVKCRPPKNRDPKGDELEPCRENYLLKQIEIINPKLIVLVGKIAVKQLLGMDKSMKELRAMDLEFEGRPCIATYHPAAAMRFTQMAVAFYEDISRIEEHL